MPKQILQSSTSYSYLIYHKLLTTKKKRDLDKLGGRDTEIILMLIELIDYGVEVFNQEEEKFQKWLSKPNLSLGGETPQSYFDSLTGIQEVKKCLDRIEYGNYA